MLNFTRMNKIVILIIAMAITTTVGFKILTGNRSKGIEIEDNGLFSQANEIEEEDDQEEEKDDLSGEVVVHITGEVSRPGIVTLKNGSRVIDAIEKAGGLTPAADERSINLAQKLFDEDKIIIPRTGENIDLEGFALEAFEPQNPQEIVISKNNPNSSANSSSDGQININTASKEELKTLPGIGDVTADKIIDYRESNKFSSIDDIKNVSGIGDKKFEAMKSMITTK